ncbi:MAG: GNAT family N-acetyltransferase [Synechococcus sp.]
MLDRFDSTELLDTVIVRRRRWREKDQVATVFEEATIAQCSRCYNPQQLQVLLRTNNPRRYSSNLTLVAECDRQIVGYASLYGTSIQAIYVSPFFTRRGIGRKLIGELENRAKARLARYLRVSASLNAEGFYRSCGYERIKASTTFYGQFEDIEIPIVEMKKDLY